jgi:filamentous hemagglutinin
MRTKGDVVNAGLIQASRALTLQAANIDNKLGGEISAGATQLAATDSITNRGLIDGGFTLLQSSEITNTGTGRIYGDQISILAGSLTNSAENGKAAVIAARERLDIGAYVIANQDGALLMSLGDMAIGKELDANGKATGQAEAFLNNSATVDVNGKLDINTRLFMNKDLYGTSVSGTTENKYIVYTKVDAADPGGSSIWFSGGVWDDHTGGFRNCAITAAMNNTLCPTDEQWNALYSTPASGGNASNATYVSTAGSWQRNDGTYVLDTTDGQVFDHPLWRLTFVTKTTAVSGETSKDPANILVGGAMSLNAETAVNDKSKIIVGGNLTVTGNNLQNIGGGGSSVTTQHDDAWYSQVVGTTRMLTGYEAMDWTTVSDYWSSPGEVRYNTVPVHTTTTIDNRNNVVVADAQPSAVGAKAIAGQAPVNATATTGTAAVAANGAVTGGTNINTLVSVVSGASTGTVGSNNSVTSGTLIGGISKVISVADTGKVTPVGKVLDVKPKPDPTGKVVRTSNSTTVTLPNNSLYIIQPVDKNGTPKGYLVETDPRFTQSKPWLGSDYMLTQMGYDPASQTKRLGDGFYEQKLMREQIAELTGRRFLEDYTNDEEQYKALMTAGIQFGQQYGLRVGVALTAEQMALLTTDIVWLVEKEVTLPGIDGKPGTKAKVLVPQVYALVKPGDIDGSGNLLSAKSIDLKLKGDMVNSGLMAARGNLSIDANNITNLAGTLKGVDVSLIAAQDIQSIQGNISAGNSLKIGAGNDVVIVAGNISAGAEFGGGANISAGHNLILAAQERGSQLIESKDKFDKDGQRINKDNYARSGTYDQTGGTLNIGGSLNMTAGNDFAAQGTQINAGGNVNISAGHDASITTAQKGSYYESVQTTVDKKKKWYGTIKTTTVNTHSNTDLTNSASNINGGSVNINAGHDVTIVGANLNGAGGVQIRGQNNTNILAAYDIKEKIDTKTVKTNSLGRLVASIGSLNPLIGPGPNLTATDKSTTDIDSTRTAQVTTINGGSGNVSLTAGNTLTLQAPQITGASTTWGGDQQTNLLLAINSREVSHTQTSRSLLWQSNQSNGSISQTAQLTNFNVPTGMSSFVGAGGISVQLPKGAPLSTQIANLAKQPGNEYLTDLATRSDIDWKQVEIVNKTWDYKKEGITQEAAIIVAIVVTILTAGCVFRSS